MAAVAVVALRGPTDEDDARAWAAAVLVQETGVVATGIVEGHAQAPYAPALLAAREGPLLAAAVEALASRPDVVLLAAAGRDHPRRAGLALHLGAALDVPTVGVTDRLLLASGPQPGAARGDTAPLLIDSTEVARWVRTAASVRPVVAHAAWRTEAAVAAEVVLRAASGARIPELLREARRLAREARTRGSTG